MTTLLEPPSYNIHEAKTRLSELLSSLESGNEFIISRAGKPIARVVPYQPPVRQLHFMNYSAGNEFLEPTDEEFLVSFENFNAELGI